MSELIPLCLLRIWCRSNNSWLSFKTVDRDLFLVNSSGYYIQLPDGYLNQISPRVTFPVTSRYPAVSLDTISPRNQYGEDALFVSMPMVVKKEMEPEKVGIESLLENPIEKLAFHEEINKPERYVLLRSIETGLISQDNLSEILELRARFKTFGSALVYGGICQWEALLGSCLDTRPPTRFDPPSLRALLGSREWELTGEILLRLGKIKRTQLELVVKIKREGMQPIGEILVAMSVCKEADLERCLKIQSELREAEGGPIALIGKLLVEEGMISDSDLQEALKNQKTARQSQALDKILVEMGACGPSHIYGFIRASGVSAQAELDEVSLCDYLLKSNTISRTQLDEALRIQQRARHFLGEFLVGMGLCSVQDIDSMIQFQRQVREIHRAGADKLGTILTQAAKVPSAKIEEGLQLQSAGRQLFGEILVALGASTVEAVSAALALQKDWRSRPQPAGDRLGEVLIKQGVITETRLKESLMQHMHEERPLGRILIERNICTPEQIIEALIDRDHKRQCEFLEFARMYAG